MRRTPLTTTPRRQPVCDVVHRQVSRRLLVRDSTLIPDLLRFEYAAHHHEVRRRCRLLLQSDDNISSKLQ